MVAKNVSMLEVFGRRLEQVDTGVIDAKSKDWRHNLFDQNYILTFQIIFKASEEIDFTETSSGAPSGTSSKVFIVCFSLALPTPTLLLASILIL